MSEQYNESKEIPTYHKALNIGAAAVAGIVTVEIISETTNLGFIALGAGALVATGVYKGIRHLARRQ